jgi:replicative DNA helicase
VFDLAGILNGTEDRNEQLEAVSSWAGLEAREGQGVVQTRPTPAKKAVPQPSLDYTAGRERERAFIKASQSHISDPAAMSYLQGRGVTSDDAKAWNLGYDPASKRIVIPFPGADWYHVDRDITGKADHKYSKPQSLKVGPQPVWNEAAMDEPAYFIVEGPLDALAVQSCGYPSVALCSTTGRQYVQAAATHKGAAILMLDNDEPGKNGQVQLSTDLRSVGVEVHEVVCKEPGDYLGKDAFEAFVSYRDSDKFTNLLAGESYQVRKEVDERQNERYRKTFNDLRVLDPVDVVGDLFLLSHPREHIPTGLAGVDEALGGGLRCGDLITLGALSSTGKTTLAVQLADTIAASGRPVLFVTIEQSAEEIVSKSVSRLVREIPRHNGGWLTISSDKMTSPAERERWQREDHDKAEAFGVACARYGDEIAPHLNIMEGIRQPTVEDVRYVAEMMGDHDEGGRVPVVFIDYLQLMASPDEHLSDKQAADHNVMDLRHMARDLKTCVFVISSLNRSSYSGGVSMDAFKESGAIEYGSDVLLGLQPRGMDDRIEETTENKQRMEARKMVKAFKSRSSREAELLVLKNRSGGLPDHGIPLAYDAMSNRFTDDPETTGSKVTTL